MKRRTIYITDFDLKRLRSLLQRTKIRNEKDRANVESLEGELDRATVVPSRDMPPDVVTMNSEVHVVDLDTGDKMTWRLVFPADADYQQGRISILAPVGTALIGFKEGDTVEWNVPSGIRRLRIKKIVYQPEAAGDYHL